MKLRDGTVRPAGGDFEVAGVTGKLRVTPNVLELIEFKGRRGEGELSATGRILWPGGKTSVALAVSARNLALDKSLYTLLPLEARETWDEVRPAGTIDADLTYATPDAKAAPVASPAAGVVTVDLTRQPAPVPAGAMPPGIHATLRPRELSINLKSAPFKLDHVAGTVSLSPGLVLLKDITARHGEAKLSLSGTGTTEDRPTWDLKVAGEGLTVDDDLRAALPAALASLSNSLKLKGKIGFELSRLAWRGAPQSKSPTTAPTTAPSTGDPEFDLVGRIHLAEASLNAGVPLEQVEGNINIDAAVRGGRLETLKGDVNLDSLTLSGRMVQMFRMTLVKQAGKSELQLAQMQGRIGGGDLAGQLTLAYPEDSPSRYALSLVVRGVDVKTLTGETEQNINGRLTASLAMEGTWDKPEARRGRGDVVVSGKEMYRIPLVLGLLQVTNLALPVSAPFENGIARYSIEGQKVTFEKIELRSNNIVMTGDGMLDFTTRQVRMTFFTDNPGAFKVPFLQDLWRGAQRELLKIQVKGTVQDPKVRQAQWGRSPTTVDEVLKGDPAKPPKGK